MMPDYEIGQLVTAIRVKDKANDALRRLNERLRAENTALQEEVVFLRKMKENVWDKVNAPDEPEAA